MKSETLHAVKIQCEVFFFVKENNLSVDSIPC